jgi:acetyl-CoA C-acetyltransferase
VPITVDARKTDEESEREWVEEVTIADDEGIRADTTYENVAKIKSAVEGGCIAAGNASQFSEGAAACVI